MSYILSIDVGTSSTKGALISPEGEVLCYSWSFYNEWGESCQYDNFSLCLWKRSFFRVLKELIAASPSSLLGISISANAPSLIPISSKGYTLGPLLHHLAHKRKEYLETQSFYISGLKSFQERLPFLYEETVCFLTASEYFVYLLTGEKVTASPCDQYDVYFWEKKELENYGLSWDKMAPFARSGEIVGKTLGEQGEPLGIPVVLSGIDYLSALLGAGASEEGILTDRAGSSEGLNLYVSGQMIKLAPFYCLPSLFGNSINIGAMLGQTGFSIDSMRYLENRSVDFRELFGYIDSLGDHQNLFYLSPSPYFWQYSLNDGIYKGKLNRNNVWSLARARVEAIGFSIRGVCEFWKTAGLKIAEPIRLTGGQSKLPQWNQLKANLIGKPLGTLQLSDTELLGNTILVSRALGLAANLEEASQRVVKIVKLIEPEPSKGAIFSEKYEQFKYLSSHYLS